MLVVKRREGDWLDVKCEKTGECFRLRVYNIKEGRGGRPSTVDIALDDAERNFYFNRPERVVKGKVEGL